MNGTGDGAMPSRKVGSGAVAGSMAAIILWAASEFGGVNVPAEIAVAITMLLTFAVQYFVRDAE